MADSGKTNETGASAAEPANGDQQNVVSRVSNLPLVSSACEVVSSAYSSTKDSVPMLKGVMDAAESGVRTLGAAATTGSKPLLDIIEPQLATVNEYAMKGLDKMEEKLPILHQPADKVVSDTVGMVYQSVAGAKDAVVGAVMGGVELTRAAVSGGIITAMGTRMGQMVSSGMGLALSRSEDWVDQNLPLTERELAAVAESATCEVTTQPASPSYFVRLGKLSDKVRERALQQSLIRARHARDTTYAAVAQITSTLNLLESARTSLGTASNQIGGASEQLLQRWTEWKQKQDGDGQTESEPDGTKDEAKQLEWRTLSMVRGLSDQLRSACSNVVSSAQGLPSAVQDQLTSARQSAEELYSSLGNTSSITPLLLEQSRHHLTQVQQSLDGVVEYLLNNTPLNWLVGPFAPQITEKAEGDVTMEQTEPHN
uniref:mannose-6-phosphate receptor binding protein 1 isoform X1 n=1 Tax=Scatophagus argus TaxID=75038 RepID=UPI001ED84EF7|nr:mannose-6-phosphate receptor binding protein 1 isoform X1 [Scatophagus argus]XP_046246981.1 mannose-6-phosphate receptor binding protein 1 isoform X1 [Scatophagus argus]XP_046246982.1 mannose-6-phosphate receptor binding protein 1 isoform X1 [Scatophagus argus]XP_046246983.1 mannose-6-phosphate receptor binding protein 1 isoform X1 [Scatophagus argus]